MPRIKRGLADGYTYHILNRGNGKQKIFHKDQDYEAFIELMRKAKERNPLNVWAYCLMPNHFHIVANAIKGEDVSKCMQWLMTSHVRRYHKHYGTDGHVWQGRFKSFVVQEDEYLSTVLRYVEGNPVRAGLIKFAKDWAWSSHRESISAVTQTLIDQPPVQLPKAWSQFVDKPLTDKELVSLGKSVNRGAPYGNVEWQRQVSKELKLESTLAPRGRPKKGH